MRIKLFWVLVGLVLSVHAHKTRRDIAAEGTDLGENEEQVPPSQVSLGGNTDVTTNATGTETAAEAPAPGDNQNQIPTNVLPSDSAAAETAGGGQGSSEEDKVNEEEIHDSLADYIADFFKGSNNTATTEQGGVYGNGTQPQTSDSAPANDTGAGSPVLDQPGSGALELNAGSGSAAEGKVGDSSAEAEPSQVQAAEPDTNAGSSDEEMDDGRNVEENVLDEDYDNDDTSSSSENTNTSSSTTRTTTPFEEEELIEVDCNKEVDLKDYCPNIPPEVRAYFNDDTTVRGLRDPVFNMDIVHELMGCERGEWCLDSRLEDFKDMQQRVKDGPLCDDGMWECIFDIMVLRDDCRNDQEFMFVVDALTLVCGLRDPETSSRSQATAEENTCFAYVLAALHVTYADFLANDMADLLPEEGEFCNGYGLRMSETYLCADNRCKGQFYSRQAMEKFGRWMWFMADLDERQNVCKIPNDTCGPLEGARVEPPTWFGMTTSSPYWTSTGVPPGVSVKGGVSAGAGEDKNKGGILGEDDQSLMIALFVATAVGLMFMVLGLLFWRRRSRRSAYYYRTVSDTYDKVRASAYTPVPSDEAHLLGRAID